MPSPNFRSLLWCCLLSLCIVGCSSLASFQKLDCLGEIRAFHQALINRNPAQAANKFRKMQKNIQAFNRGINPLFYRYVQFVGLSQQWLGPQSKQVVLHGDFHIENLGAFKDGRGKLVVDLMDFDDSFQGPALLDVYRCASSLYLVASSDTTKEKIVNAFVDAYADTMQKIAARQMSADIVLDEHAPYELVGKLIEAAGGANVQSFYSDFAHSKVEEGRRVFSYHEDYTPFPKDEAKALIRSYTAGRSYVPGFYDMQDAVVERGGGIGSAGTFKVRIFVRGPTDGPFDDILLEFKQEVAPAGQIFSARPYADQGQRVLEGQRVMQTRNPPGIGTARLGDKQFFVSELSPFYEELQWSKLVGVTQMREAATIAGVLLAKGHARSTAQTGDIALETANMLNGRLEQFRSDVMNFCVGYDRYLKQGYEQFSRELTVSPLLCIVLRRLLMEACYDVC